MISVVKMFQKRPPYRNKKILAYAKGQDCTIRLPGCRNQTETTVAAHIHEYEFGHGKGIKADDCCIAYVCYHCHILLDSTNDFEKEWLKGQFHLANTRTMRILFRNGIVK
jgi:hypothetical protein